MNNWISLILKGCWAVLVPPLNYLHVKRSKKKATQVRLTIAIFIEVVPWAEVYKDWMTLIGRGCTLVEGGSSF